MKPLVPVLVGYVTLAVLAGCKLPGVASLHGRSALPVQPAASVASGGEPGGSLAGATTSAARPGPTTGDASASPTVGATAAAVPAAAAIEIPTRISLDLPASVGIIANNSGSILANNAGNVISNNGAAAGGTGTAAFGLLADAFSIVHGVADQLELYTRTTLEIETTLGALAKHHPRDGETVTLTAQEVAPVLEEGPIALVRRSGDQVVIRCSVPSAPDMAHPFLIISFVRPSAGTAYFRVPDNRYLGNAVVVTHYDRDAGMADADVYSDRRKLSRYPGVTRERQTFTLLPPGGAGGPSAKIRTNQYVDLTQPSFEGRYALAANFQADGAFAVIEGAQPAALATRWRGAFGFVTATGTQPPGSATPHDFYVDASGRDLAATSAPAGLKAILPADTDLLQPNVVAPDRGDPFADPALQPPS